MAEEKGTLTGIVSRIRNQVATEHIKGITIEELLIEKGIITREEFNERYEKNWEKRSDHIFDYLEEKIDED